MAQKVARLSLTQDSSWKTLPVHPEVSGYLTLVREGLAAKRWASLFMCCALDMVEL